MAITVDVFVELGCTGYPCPKFSEYGRFLIGKFPLSAPTIKSWRMLSFAKHVEQKHGMSFPVSKESPQYRHVMEKADHQPSSVSPREHVVESSDGNVAPVLIPSSSKVG